MDPIVGSVSTSWQDIDELIAILRAWGVSYLVGLEPAAHTPELVIDRQSVGTLLQRLAQCDEYPRVRDAIISLLLLHPELANAVQQALRESTAEVAERIAVLTLATLYLQRLWSLRLTIALEHPPGFSELQFAFLWKKRNLPSPACHYGSCGLLALQEYEQKRTGLPFTFIGDWQNQVNQLLAQEEARQRHKPVSLSSLAATFIKTTEYCEEESCMSMRRGVDKAAIESFLQQLGRAFHKPARLYLVGGAALVHLGIRPGFTQDIDVQVFGANEGDLIVTIQKLIERLQINVEFAAPGDFIPLPLQWEAHAQFVGRYGTIDVFYFDFYSIALSKIERGNDRDIADVKLLIQHGMVTPDELDKAYREVLAQLGRGRYPRITPQRFTEQYQAIRQLL
ncbi:MAG: DUF6036 family nucleotidyltransferase [Ktedonobacteraceae bacterium]